MEGIEATFKGENQDEAGEVIGPLIVWDHDKGTLWKEFPEWMKHSEAKRLAEENGWHFSEDM